LKLTASAGIVATAVFALCDYAQTVCQPAPEMRPEFQNLSFVDGAPGNAPPGWFLGPEWFMPPHTPVYEALIVSGGACNGNRQCATVRSLRDDPSIPLTFLYQVVDATQYRGKRLTYRADVRAEVTFQSAARLLVRIHRADCGTSFRDDMGNHPITVGTWSPYQIQAPVAPDARDIEFGIQLIGQGAAWIDNISITFADN
jgi:hypothetical protein